GVAVLRSVSRRHLPIRDVYWEHITHCSPCFQEFLQFRTDLTTSRKRLVRRNRLLLGTGVVAVAIAGLFGLPAPHHLCPPTLTAETVSNIDMRPFSVTRGDSDNPLPTGQYAGILRRTRSQLNVILPIGAEEGNYEVRLMDNNRRPVVPSMTVTALFADHLVK